MEYRTAIGTKFYNRESELSLLHSLVGKSSFIILWGPKNVGKSELLRYFSHLIAGRGWITYYVDVREYLSKNQLSIYPRSTGCREFLESIASLIGVPNRILEVFEKGYKYALELKASGVLWVFDEPHYLSNARPFLEAVIKRVVYSFHKKPLSIAVSVSDGWFIVSDVVLSLLDYGAYELFVKELDYNSFYNLYRELQEKLGTRISVDARELYKEYTGGNPGYLVELLNTGSLSQWISKVEKLLLQKTSNVVEKTGLSRREVYSYISSLPREVDMEAISLNEYRLLKELLKQNIVYYDILEVKAIVKPLLPLYKKILEKRL